MANLLESKKAAGMAHKRVYLSVQGMVESKVKYLVEEKAIMTVEMMEYEKVGSLVEK